MAKKTTTRSRDNGWGLVITKRNITKRYNPGVVCRCL